MRRHDIAFILALLFIIGVAAAAAGLMFLLVLFVSFLIGSFLFFTFKKKIAFILAFFFC